MIAQETTSTLDSLVLLEGLPQAVAVFNQNLFLTNWNLKFQNIFNFSESSEVQLKDILSQQYNNDGADSTNAMTRSILDELSKSETIEDLFDFTYEYKRASSQYYRVTGNINEKCGLIITLTDITAHRQAEAFLSQSNDLITTHMQHIEDNTQDMERRASDAIYMAEELAIARQAFEDSAIHTQAILDAMAEGLVTIDEQGKIRTINNAITEIFNYAIEDIEGKNILYLFKSSRFPTSDDLVVYINHMEDKEYKATVTASRKDGSTLSVELSIREIHLDHRREFTVLFRDITKRLKAEKMMQHMALRDSLTGLANRNLLKQKLDEGLHNAKRLGNTLAVMFLDLDMFKPVNDLYGHGVGDKLLQVVAQRLLACARNTDTVARLGGDEFAIVCTHIDTLKSVQTVAQRIINSIQEPVVIGDHTIQIGTSIGISFYPDDSLDPDELIRMADMALYKAKEDGRRTFRLYNKAMDSELKEEKQISIDLAQAIDNEDLFLHYQPQVQAKTHKLIAVEALIRWQHPEKGMIPPGSFIPVAESSGLILPIGEWLLETACKQAKEWQDQGVEPFRVCVNISAREFKEKTFVETVIAALKKSELDPQWLELEITEGMVLEDTEVVITKLERLTNLGVTLAIDDFGTGYSSLAYLKRFPVHQLKIDQSFIRDIITDSDDSAITDAVIQLGHSLGLSIVGEGVEHINQVLLLEEKGCDLLQGYYFSRPLAPSDLIDWMKGRE